MKRIALLVFVFIFCISDTCYCENKISKQKTGQKNIFSYEHINPDIYELPINYYGNNFIEVYNIFSRVVDLADKNEYESTQEYKNKINGIKPLIIKGTLKSDGIFAFYFKDIETRYDADKKVFEVDVRTNEIKDMGISGKINLFYDDFKPESMKLSSLLDKSTKYVGSNNFGVKKIINAEDRTTYAVILRGSYRIKDVWGMSVIQLTMPSDEAKEANKKGRLILLCNLIPPFISIGSTYKAPKMDFPYEISEKINYLIVKPKEFWFYNYETGKIYNKKIIK